MSGHRLEVRGLQPGDWPALERLFGKRGACGGCWCMAWRLGSKEWAAGKTGANRRAFRNLVTSGGATGTIALRGEDAVGWCSAGPRAAFERLARKPSLRTDWDESTWSVTCFFLHRDWRGKGIAKRLLDAAVRLARDEGARRIEGYPVVPTAGFGAQTGGGRRMPSAFVWTGLPAIFERAGFRAMRNPPGKRPIYLRELHRRHA